MPHDRLLPGASLEVTRPTRFYGEFKRDVGKHIAESVFASLSFRRQMS